MYGPRTTPVSFYLLLRIRFFYGSIWSNVTIIYQVSEYIPFFRAVDNYYCKSNNMHVSFHTFLLLTTIISYDFRPFLDHHQRETEHKRLWQN
jgi:hypothetical protein